MYTHHVVFLLGSSHWLVIIFFPSARLSQFFFDINIIVFFGNTTWSVYIIAVVHCANCDFFNNQQNLPLVTTLPSLLLKTAWMILGDLVTNNYAEYLI